MARVPLNFKKDDNQANENENKPKKTVRKFNLMQSKSSVLETSD